MTTIPGSVRVAGFIGPSDTTDVYPTHVDIYGKGGFRAVADTAARDAITADRRVVGMWVKVIDIDKVYTLVGGITNGDWVEQTMGGGGDVLDVDTTYYVDGSTGNDANDGLTWLTAKKTFGFLYPGELDSLPRCINASFICYFRNDIRARNAKGNLYITGFYGSGSMMFIGTPTAVETFTASTYENNPTVRNARKWVKDGTKAWTPNAWRRHFVDLGHSYNYPVYSNTGDTLYMGFGDTQAGSYAATIYSAPEILRELVTLPGTKHDFGPSLAGFFSVEMCSIPVTVSNAWIDEDIGTSGNSTWCTSGELIIFFNVALANHYISNVRQFVGIGCYYNLVDYGVVQSGGIGENIWGNCAIDSTDSTGYGFTAYESMGCRLVESVVVNQLMAFSAWSGVITLGKDVMIDHCEKGVTLFGGIVELGPSGALSPCLRFDTVVEGIVGNGSINVTPVFGALGWGVTREIVFGDTDEDTFAALTAGTVRSRVDLTVTYVDLDYFYIPRDEYDNSISGLTAVRYQTAIDELFALPKNINVATFATVAVDLIDDTDFTAVEAVPYVTEGIGYQLSVTPTTAVGLLTVILYQDVARAEPVYTLVVDLSDADTYRSVEAFGFELETDGTLYGTAFVSGVGGGETFDISLTAAGVEPAVLPPPLPSPYGDGIEDDGLGKPRVAFPSDGGLVFALGKVKIKPNATVPVYPVLAAAGVSITGAVTTTTDENISAKKLFTAVGSGHLGTAGPPVAGTYLVGHEILDSDGIKYRCTGAGTPGTWELADSVSDAEADYSTAELAAGAEEVLEILTTGNVGTIQLLQVWAVVDAVADYSTDFRLRVYRTADGYGREVMWQASGVARQSYLTAILPAAQDFVEVHDEDMFDTDEACIIYEDDARYELARIIARSAGNMDLCETLVDALNWAANTWVCSVAEFENVPFRNTDTTPANQNRVFLQVRNNHATNAATFYVRVWPLSLGVLR